MKLKDYLNEERIHPAYFAVTNGISITSIYRYLKGERPQFSTACKIEKVTNGKVTVEEMRGPNGKE